MSNITPTSSFEIPGLSKEKLIELFQGAKIEADRLQTALDKIADAGRRIEINRNEKVAMKKTRRNDSKFYIPFIGFPIVSFIISNIFRAMKLYSPIITIMLAAFSFSGIVVGCVQYFGLYKKYGTMIEEDTQIMSHAEGEARKIIAECKTLPIIPSEYRTPLALQTMIKYLLNGQADNWKECSHRYDEQLHWWTMEKTSAEALEIQKYTALMTELTAKRAKITAVATTISAVSDILSWFR